MDGARRPLARRLWCNRSPASAADGQTPPFVPVEQLLRGRHFKPAFSALLLVAVGVAPGLSCTSALALDPGYASAWHFYGVVLFDRGLHRKSLHALNRALDLDPLSPIFAVQVASLYYLMRDLRHAARLCDGLIRLEPEFGLPDGSAACPLRDRAERAKLPPARIGCGDVEPPHYTPAALAHLEASMGITASPPAASTSRSHWRTV